MSSPAEVALYVCSCSKVADWVVIRKERARGPRGALRGMVTAATGAGCHEHLRDALLAVMGTSDRANLEVRQIVRPPRTQVTMAGDDSPCPTVGQVLEWGEEWALVRWPTPTGHADRREAIDQLAPARSSR